MSGAIAEDRLSEYFQGVSHLNNGASIEQNRYEEQVALVEEARERTDLLSFEREILEGEHAFYRGQYKIALKHYLAAKESPHCQFCCLRASAFVLQQQGKTDKAVSYAKRALAMQPDDAMTLFLTGKLLPSVKQGEASEQLEQKVAEIASRIPQEETEQAMPISLAGEEVDALKEIFTAGEPEEVPLVSEKMEEVVARNIRETEMETKQEEGTDTVVQPAEATDSLQQLAESHYEVKTKDTDAYLNKMGIGIDTENELQKQIEAYQERRRDLIATYTKASRTSRTSDHGLFLFSGWKDSEAESRGGELLAASTRKAAGGFFVRWNGKGVAVNPGPDFLHNFHEAGLHIGDIDHVVVTRATPDAYSDTHAIYDLNYQLNLTAASDDLHIIHYYLNQQAHRDLASKLKPNFKQERHTVHSLELYVDSPDVEKVELSPEIQLHYFACGESESESKDGTSTCLGMRLECQPQDTSGCSATIGHVSGTGWSPLLAHNLGRCDILIAGFQNTSSKDYRKVKYNDDSLGYFGCYSLMEEVAPRLMLCSEFEGKEGDIRLEVTRKMRHEYAYSNQNGTSILPGDKGFYLDLKTMQVRCSVSGEPTDPSQIRVTKGKNAFGNLQYISPSCFA
jgi:tetratricopeptide (TPR) repeat protein